ncbi:LysE family translocator [Streptomyces sp. NBC_00358]|uniref:LysE family translocator n=1 Tax=Streptomyces sp. NBC_00358 TaxID=2975725 RepID=UPI002E2569C3
MGTTAGADEETVTGGWRQGTLTNLLNPKMGAFYVAVLPQFIPPGADHFTTGLLLTTVHVLIGFARILHGWLRKPQARRVLDRITGTVIGIRLALSN